MKMKLQDIPIECLKHDMCDTCPCYSNGECITQFNGVVPSEFYEYVMLCKTIPEFAKDIFENKEVEF